jgi:5-methylcytosine-specific restriction protein A
MTDPLAALHDSLAELRAVWQGDCAEAPSVDALGRRRLVAVNDALGALRRHVDAVHVQIAAEIARESRPELGSDSLAKEQGFKNPTAFIAATTGTTGADAAQLVAVGEATAPRMTFSGEAAPAKYRHIAEALTHGRLGAKAAAAIVAMLDRVAMRADRDALDQAELTLTRQAAGLTLGQLAVLIARAEAHLDADGIAPTETERRSQRALHMYERDGVLHVNVTFDVESGAPVKAAIDALVTAEFRRNEPEGPDVERRTVAQRRADALALLAAHVLGCRQSDLPLDGATVVVRVDLEQLQRGTGSATIDGIAQPISIGAVRRMAAGGGIIPCVLNGGSEVLDWGREKRLFTKAQRLALVERDGGCAMCALPPSMTKAHHVRWWERDAGPTDLDNGVLLCESCHHRIHDNGWDIRIEGTGPAGRVWFIPPAHVDPGRTPRLGGRARFDYQAA